MDQEKALIKKAKNGDEDAFRQLMEGRISAVYNLSLRMMQNCADAEDAAQDALVKVFSSLPSFQGQSSFSTWVIFRHTQHMLGPFEEKEAPPRTGHAAGV